MGAGGWVLIAACTIVVIGLIVAAVAWLTAAQRDRGGRGDAPTGALEHAAAAGEPQQRGDGVSPATPLAPVEVASDGRP
jgi:hypothetical protein